MKKIVLSLFVAAVVIGCDPETDAPISSAYDDATDGTPNVELVAHEEMQRVDVLVDGELFTSYVYTDTLPVLKKPVLFPVNGPDGTPVTRGYPIATRPGERVDHPHQIGFWLNYGNVNGLDFWNNSDAIPADRAHAMGTVRHRSIEKAESGRGRAELVVTADWLAPGGGVVLRESTHLVFEARAGVRSIDRTTTLTAGGEDVSMPDDKEGFLGLRVARALEVPADRTVRVAGAAGEVIDASAAEGATGVYRNSEGVHGYPDVWGRRARWMTLTGTLESGPVTVAVLDHPDNPGHPTHWHARDYGLFAANPLGPSEFSEGSERLDYRIPADEAATFRYQLVIAAGEQTPQTVEDWYRAFATGY